MIEVTANDLGYAFTDQLIAPDGTPANLNGKTVRFVLRAGDEIFSATADPVNADSGLVRYVVGSSFPRTPGDYRQVWQSAEGETYRLTYPNHQYNPVRINPDLSAP